MAIQKTVTSSQGISADYHRVTDINFYLNDDANKRVVVEVALFKDAAARSGGNKPLDKTEYEVLGADYTNYFSSTVLDVADQNPFERAYVYLKTLTTPVDFTTGTTDV